MKNRTSKISMVITLLSAVLIITIGYKALAFAGDFILKNDTEISYLPTDNITTYVFYSQSEDEINLYPWNYYHDAISFQNYMEDDLHTLESFDIWSLYNSLIFYFYRMVPDETASYLYKEDIKLYDRIDFFNIEKDLFVKIVNNEPIFYYSKDMKIYDKTYNLRFAFSQSYLLSFEIKLVSNTVLSSEQMDSSKQFLTDYINSTENNSIAMIYYDILSQRGFYDSYSLLTNNFNNDKLHDSEKQYFIDESEDIAKNSSYQLIDNDNEFLIVLLENNVVIHFDPVTSMITGFNLSETYIH